MHFQALGDELSKPDCRSPAARDRRTLDGNVTP
jgi:hypothetical protein